MATTTQTVASEILNQIGNKALTMIGAWSFASGTNCVSFRVGKNEKGVKAIRIDLNASDLYDMKFYSIRGLKVEVVADVKDVYADQLSEIIEAETGMYTRL